MSHVNPAQTVAHLELVAHLLTEASYFMAEPSEEGARLTEWSMVLGGLADTVGAIKDQLVAQAGTIR